MMTMTSGRVTGEIFELDTSGFDSVITKTQKLSNKMTNLKVELDALKDKLMHTWAGEGRNTFEKKYRLLAQQFEDLSTNLDEISEELVVKSEQYIQADVDLSKTLDGTDNRY